MKDDCVLINGDYVKVYNFAKKNNVMYYVIGKKLLPVNEIYDSPCKSSQLMSQIVQLDDKFGIWKCAKIEAKLCKIQYKDKLYVLPLLHAYKCNR